MGRGQRRPAVHLGLRRHRARAPGRRREARRRPRDARLPQRERLEPGRRRRGARHRRAAAGGRARVGAHPDAARRRLRLAQRGEQKSAQSSSEQAQLALQRAKLASTQLEVSDCILRAPFDGEIATRTVDPGAFVRPGTPIVSVVDRNTVRMTFDVPESDFEVVAPGTPRVDPRPRDRHDARRGHRAALAQRRPRDAHGARRGRPRRPEREIPVNTTGEVQIDGRRADPRDRRPPRRPRRSPGSKATLFVVDGDVAHQSDVRRSSASRAATCSSRRRSRRDARRDRGPRDARPTATASRRRRSPTGASRPPRRTDDAPRGGEP